MRFPIIFLSIIIFSYSVQASPELILQHENIQPGETIIGEIITSGEFSKEIENHDITFFEGRKEVFFEYDITFFEGKHYFYAYAEKEGNFTIKISNILYKEGDTLGSSTIEKIISIQKDFLFDEETNETYTEIMSIKPGFSFKVFDEPEIKLTNKNSRELNLIYNETEIILGPFESKTFALNPKEVFSFFNVSTYKDFSIPIIYLSANDSIEPVDGLQDLKPQTQQISTNLIAGESETKKFLLYNFGDFNLTNIVFSTDLDFLEIEEIDSIAPRGIVNLTLIFSPENPGHFEGEIKIKYNNGEEDFTLIIPLSLFVLEEGSDLDNFTISDESCEELGGASCSNDETCNGDATFAQGRVYCCLGTCEVSEESGSGSAKTWGGIILFLILGGVGYYFYKKSKKVKGIKPEEKIESSTKSYAKRISGSLRRS